MAYKKGGCHHVSTSRHFLLCSIPRSARLIGPTISSTPHQTWNPEHYPSTPKEGMTFARRGLPDWVDSTYGLSLREEGGRWTDSSVSRVPGLAFTRKLNGPFCLLFTATVAPALIGKTFGVRMGNQTKTLQVIPQGLAEYQVQLTEAAGGDRPSFLLPGKMPRENEVDLGSADTRRLGLELTTLRILPGTCVGAQVQPEARP